MDNTLKRLQYLSSHRGSKEMDFILGEFFTKCALKLNKSEMAMFEEILLQDDILLYNWIMGHNLDVIEKYQSMIHTIRNFHKIGMEWISQNYQQDFPS